jgi:hypothetical protein
MTKENWQKKEQIKDLISIITDRIWDLKTLKGGLIMDNEVFKLVLKKHPKIKKELEILEDRNFNLKRKLWKL